MQPHIFKVDFFLVNWSKPPSFRGGKRTHVKHSHNYRDPWQLTPKLTVGKLVCGVEVLLIEFAFLLQLLKPQSQSLLPSFSIPYPSPLK